MKKDYTSGMDQWGTHEQTMYKNACKEIRKLEAGMSREEQVEILQEQTFGDFAKNYNHTNYPNELINKLSERDAIKSIISRRKS